MLYTRWRASDTEKFSRFWVPLTAVVSIEERDGMAGVEESSLQRNLRVLSIDERRKYGQCLACAQHPEK